MEFMGDIPAVEGEKSESADLLQYADVYFSEVEGRYVPRNVFVDLEPGVIWSIQSKDYGQMFNPDSFVHAQNGAGNVFGKGFYSEGCEIIEEVMEAVRK